MDKGRTGQSYNIATKLQDQAPNRLVRVSQAPLGRELPHFTIAEREAEIEPGRMPDDHQAGLQRLLNRDLGIALRDVKVILTARDRDRPPLPPSYSRSCATHPRTGSPGIAVLARKELQRGTVLRSQRVLRYGARPKRRPEALIRTGPRLLSLQANCQGRIWTVRASAPPSPPGRRRQRLASGAGHVR
jgi:hypothetical protein